MKIPEHIAIILDGNRRWAENNNLPKAKGHEKGAKKISELIDWCLQLKIKELSLYSFSVENFNRDEKEVDFLMELFRKQFKKLKDNKDTDKKKLRIRVIGRKTLFPEDIQESFEYIEKKTENNSALTINFCMGYSGRDEIVEACKKMIKDGISNVDEEEFRKYLFLESYPDILIRPGGEIRISNFLLWQCAYSEFYFCKKLWPEFEKEDMLKAIEEYSQRQRRFGK